ncbi:unnamed protein product [Rotaria magnacalcarata]|uniref:Uncharacterized protein n=2 Tax=Rotaria magnacalcarata TaxID=392030 RepID=A0A816Q9I2_9BILA|nr:unnamed protein product [Rotaria magnacalcarata]CAF4433725.1 unnamed protein product [Rotaria magnacalcarata]
MSSRAQKPTLRDFLLVHAQTRTRLCKDSERFDPCDQLAQLTSFEKATLMSWSTDSNVDRGLNLYILLHYLSAINNNFCYYHYVNNGNPDGTRSMPKHARSMPRHARSMHDGSQNTAAVPTGIPMHPQIIHLPGTSLLESQVTYSK